MGNMVSQSGLLDRGWTKGLIKKFLPEPDSTKCNPYYKAGPPMKLYALSRVEGMEESDQFIAAKEKAKKRQDAAAKAVQTKKANTMDYVNEIKINVPLIKKKKLRRLASDHYDDFQIDRWLDGDGFGDLMLTSQSSDPVFLSRISVNYLRHCATEYDCHLDGLSRKVGKFEAHKILKDTVLCAIAEKYPWLAEECKRQQLLNAETEKYVP